MDTDSQGRNTLHISLDRLVPNPQIVELLLIQAPEACQQRSFTGELPVQVAYHRYCQALQHVEARPHSLSAQRDRDQWWKVVVMVLKATMKQKNNIQPSILHVALATDAPVEVIKKLAALHPETVSLVNAEGAYPILLATAMRCYSKDATVNLLLDLEPTLASHDGPDGRTVLTTATLYSGLSELTIYRLVCARPDAVRQLDQETSMFPFMIAAACPPDENVSMEHDLEQLGVIFELIKAAPDLVGMGSLR